MKIKYIFLHAFIPLLLGLLIYINSKFIGGIFRNYLPDAFWSYSFSSSFYVFNTKMNLYLKPVFLNFIFVLYEILQHLKIIKGTFDFNDILVYLVFSFLAYYIFKKTKFKNHEVFKAI